MANNQGQTHIFILLVPGFLLVVLQFFALDLVFSLALDVLFFVSDFLRLLGLALLGFGRSCLIGASARLRVISKRPRCTSASMDGEGLNSPASAGASSSPSSSSTSSSASSSSSSSLAPASSPSETYLLRARVSYLSLLRRAGRIGCASSALRGKKARKLTLPLLPHRCPPPAARRAPLRARPACACGCCGSTLLRVMGLFPATMGCRIECDCDWRVCVKWSGRTREEEVRLKWAGQGQTGRLDWRRLGEGSARAIASLSSDGRSSSPVPLRSALRRR